jgi:hypothetical protein
VFGSYLKQNMAHYKFNSLDNSLNHNVKHNMFILNYIQRFNSYRAVNTLRLGCKNQSVNAVREIIAVCSEFHTKHINTLRGQKVVLLNVKLVVHIVTTGL